MWHAIFVGNASLSFLGCLSKRENARIVISLRETVWLLEFLYQYGVSSHKHQSWVIHRNCQTSYNLSWVPLGMIVVYICGFSLKTFLVVEIYWLVRLYALILVMLWPKPWPRGITLQEWEVTNFFISCVLRQC